MAIKNYELYQGEAFAGMIYDLSPHTIDTFAVEDANGIGAGVAVIRGTDPEKQIKAAAATGDGANVIGVTLYSHKEQVASGGYYPKGYAVSVLTKGRVWVAVGGAVTAGAEAKLKVSDSTFVAGGGEADSDVEAVGCGAKFLTSTEEAGLAVIEIG